MAAKIKVSDRIREAIQKSGYSFVELEKRTGFSKSALQRYSSGVTEKIPIDVIEVLSNVLGVTAEYLMGWDKRTDEIIDSIRNKIPLYSVLCCGTGIFVDENIEDYIVIPDRMVKNGKEYFANTAIGDSMIGKGINDGDIIIFEKTNVLENGNIGAFCINDGNCVCKIFRKLKNGMVILESANDNYDPIEVDLTDDCFRIIGKYIGMIKIGE